MILGDFEGHKSVIEEHPADTLEIDARVQRHGPSAGRITSLADKFNPDAMGLFLVSARPDNRKVLLDGQTRQAVLAQLGVPDWPVRCEVFYGLTLEQEARLFRDRNNSNKPTALDDFLVGLTEGDAECVAINKIVVSAALRVDRQARDGNVTCVSKLRLVYRLGGANALAPAIRIPIAAWGSRSESVDGYMIWGFGEFFHRYGPDVDREALVRKLAKFPGGPSGLLGSAKGLKAMKSSGTTVARCLADQVRDIYNHGRATKLPPL